MEALEAGAHEASTGIPLGLRPLAQATWETVPPIVLPAHTEGAQDLGPGQALRRHRHRLRGRQERPGKVQHGAGRHHRRAGRVGGNFLSPITPRLCSRSTSRSHYVRSSQIIRSFYFSSSLSIILHPFFFISALACHFFFFHCHLFLKHVFFRIGLHHDPGAFWDAHSQSFVLARSHVHPFFFFYFGS